MTKSSSISLDEFGQLMANNIANGPNFLAVSTADQAFNLLINNLSNNSGFRPVGLANYGFASWRSAAVLSKAGNVGQVPALLRLCIEAFLYAHLFKESAEWRKVWEKRETDKKAKTQFRNDGMRKVKQVLGDKNQPLLDETMRLYDNLITIGAHPNNHALELITSYDFKPNEERGMVYFAQLGDDEQRYHCYLNCLNAASVCLRICREMWPDTYQIMGIEALRIKMLTQANVAIALRPKKTSERE